MAAGHNRLPELQHRAAGYVERIGRAEADLIVSHQRLGALLIEAKSMLKHGEWLPWLDDAGIPVQTAQRAMKLAGYGFKNDTLSYLGGLAGALDFGAALHRVARAGELRETLPTDVDRVPDWVKSQNVTGRDLEDLLAVMELVLTLAPTDRMNATFPPPLGDDFWQALR